MPDPTSASVLAARRQSPTISQAIHAGQGCSRCGCRVVGRRWRSRVVDSGPHVGGVAAVLRRCREPVISGGHQGAVHDRDRADPAFAYRRQCQQRSDRVDHRCAAAREIPNNGPICRMVRFVRQYMATSSTLSTSGNAHCRPGRPSAIASPPRWAATRTSLRN
jgi:hypothetical protein